MAEQTVAEEIVDAVNQVLKRWGWGTSDDPDMLKEMAVAAAEKLPPYDDLVKAVRRLHAAEDAYEEDQCDDNHYAIQDAADALRELVEPTPAEGQPTS